MAGNKQSVRSRYLRDIYKNKDQQADRTIIGERGRGNSEESRASQGARSVITKHLNFVLAENGILQIAYPVSPFQPRYSSPSSPTPSLIRVHLDSLLPPLARRQASRPMPQTGKSQLEEAAAPKSCSRRRSRTSIGRDQRPLCEAFLTNIQLVRILARWVHIKLIGWLNSDTSLLCPIVSAATRTKGLSPRPLFI